MSGPLPPREPKVERVVVETTRRCNLRCIHCAFSPENNMGGYDAGEMPVELFEKLVPVLSRYRPEVQLSGHGETLLHPGFLSMLRKAVLAGCAVSFETNGMLLTPKSIEQIVRSGVSSITFSLDGASAGVYEPIRRGARFERVVRNIAAVAEAREREGREIPLGIEFVAMRRNIHELPELVRLAARLGVFTVQVAHLIEYNLTRGQAVTEDVETLPWIERAEKEARANGVFLRLPSNLPGRGGPGGAGPGTEGPSARPAAKRRKACTEPWDSLFVQANGEILPCCVIREVYGDLATQSFEEIWSGPKYRRLRSALRSEKPFAECAACSFYGWRERPSSRPKAAAARKRPGRTGPAAAARWRTDGLSETQRFWLLGRLLAPDDLASRRGAREGTASAAEECLRLLAPDGALAPEEFVCLLYRRLLRREPDPRGLASHVRALRSGAYSALEVVESFLTSEEFARQMPAL